MRHKTNWERVLSAIDSITGKRNAAAARATVYAYRATPEGQRKRREYARKYYRENREKCNAASLKCHKRRQAAKAGNSKTTKAEG